MTVATGEFDLIDRIAARCRPRADVLLGIGDDAALLQPPVGESLAISCDLLNVEVHFRADDPPATIGHKAAAVNLSDLAAMAARPLWCTLGLALPAADPAWLDGFLDGFLGLADQHGLALVGGDTTRGPLAIAVTVHGSLPAGQALRRDGGRAGDDLWLSGTVGDAAAGLRGLGRSGDAAYLRERLQRPTPRVELGLALRGRASACIDVSDGLLADLGHLLQRSQRGAELQLAALPTSSALTAALPDPSERWNFQLSGGDDYELLFSAEPMQRAALNALAAELQVPLTRIGRLRAEPGLSLYDGEGRSVQPAIRGYQHFVTERR